MQCGPIRFKVTAKEQSAKHSFEHFIVPCFTGFRKPYSLSNDSWHITQIYATLAEDEARNERIVEDVKDVLDDGRTPIILTQRTEQVNCLANKLKGLTDAHIITLIGASSPKEKVVMIQKLESIPANESLVIIATGKYVGEGFDYPRLDTLFLASPIAWKGTLAQYVGRLHREYPGKQSVMVYDYVDIHVPVLERMYHKRLRGYAQLGYKVLSNKDAPEKTSLIYNAENYVAALAADVAEAKHDVIIATPYIRKAQYKLAMEKWNTLIPTSVNVRVDTQAPTSYIIIDSHIVWYGDINLFAINKAESMMIRLDSSELAGELINLKE
jgi:superfamily II DNA or RNA helicase